jgi:YD repeat-containing protein
MRTLAVLLLFITNAFAFNHKSAKEGLWISPESLGSEIYEVGDTVNFKGKICVYKKHILHKFKNHSCHKLKNYPDFKNYKLRFFYPDSNTEVTELVSLNELNDGIEYSFQSSALQKDVSHELIVTVEEENKVKDKLLEVNAKITKNLEVLKEKFEEKKSRLSEKHQARLEKIISLLDTIIIRVKRKRFINPHMFSELRQPVALKNEISKPSYYSTLFGGMRLSLEVDNANPFHGEKVEVKAIVNNINYVEDPEMSDSKYEKYKWMYKLEVYEEETLVYTSPKSSMAKLHEIEHKFYSKSLESNRRAKFNLRLIRTKDINLPPFLSWLVDQQWGMIETHIDVLEDNASPVFKNTPQMSYYKNFPGVVEEITDSLGRISKESIKLYQVGTSLNNENINLEVIPQIVAVNPEINDHSNHYLLNFVAETQEEGLYQIMVQAQDSASNFAVPNPQVYEFRIDRTKPVLTINVEDNQLTNNPSFSLPVEIFDDSPVTTKVYRNEELVSESNEASNNFSVPLQEGNNKIEVKTVDAAGNEADVFTLHSIVLDTIAPILVESYPKNDDVIRLLNFTVTGTANEALSRVVINQESVAEVSGTSFSLAKSYTTQGEKSYEVELTDLAGNSSVHVTDYLIVLKLIRTELITVVQDPNSEKLMIIGAAGSVVPNIDLDISGGFFNSTETTVKDDGSFMASLDFFKTATIEAYYAPIDKYEAETISSNIDTGISGIVKGALTDEGLAGVKVTILENNVSTTTDAMGVFQLPNPETGDISILVDGASAIVSDEVEKEYGAQVVKLSLALTKSNIVDEIIYLSPMFKDGSETAIYSTQGATVTSQYAEGVELDVPAGVAKFSSIEVDPETGEEIPNFINVVKVSSDRVTAGVPESLKPDYVYSFEPSGLEFTERIKLTLPNENEFVVGTKLAILSKNSSEGQWEIDGVATVTSPDRIETDEGLGISHFSEIYAVPYSPDISNFNQNKDRPQLTNKGNSVTSMIQLPSFKKFGQDITPKLTYKSDWANPRALVSQIFNMPRYNYVQKIDEKQGNVLVKVETTGSITQWSEPEYIESQFFVSSYESDPIRFNIENAPDQAVVSYSMNLDNLETGIHPARSSFKLKYKAFTHTSYKVKRTKVGEPGHILKRVNELEVEDKFLFPEDLENVLFHQNYISSNAGRGWRLGLTQKIYNPELDNLMVEESNGEVSQYVIDNTVENIFTADSLLSFNSDNYPEIMYTDSNGFINTFDVDTGNLTSSRQTANYDIEYGVNFAWRYRRRKISRQFSSDEYDHYYRCIKARYPFSITRKITSTALSSEGLLYLDSKGALYKEDTTEDVFLAGELGTPPRYYDYFNYSQPDWQSACESISDGFQCENPTYYQNYTYRHRSTSSNVPPSPGRCSARPTQDSSGVIPLVGGDDSTFARESKLNNPKFFVPSKLNGNVIYIADYGNNVVKRINTLANTTSDILGNRDTVDDTPEMLDDNRVATETAIYRPTGIIEDSQGNLYVSSFNGFIRKLSPSGLVSVIAGKDGTGAQSQSTTLDKAVLKEPSGMVLDEDNQILYVADSGHHRVVALDLELKVATQVAGSGSCNPGDKAAGKPALLTSICSPTHIGLDNQGNLLILDHENDLLRRVIFQKSDNLLTRYKAVADDGSKIIRHSNGSLERVYRNGSRVLFDNEGYHLRSINKNSKETSFIYSGDKLTKIHFADDTYMNISYAGEHLSSITDPVGRTTYFTISGGKLTQVDFPDASFKTFDYRPNDGAMISESDKRGNITEYIYNKWDFLEKVLRPDGNEIVMSYGISDTIGNDFIDGSAPKIQNQTNEEGDNEFKDLYTNANGVTTEMYKDMTGYVDKIVQKIDGEDRETLITRDNKGRPTKITRYDGTYAEFKYSDSVSMSLPVCEDLIDGDFSNTECRSREVGDLIYKFDSKTGEEEYFRYNKFGDLLYKSLVVNNEVVEWMSAKYDIEGNLIEQEDANGNKVFKDYYPNTGLLESSKVIVGEQELKNQYFYNDNGNMRLKIAPSGEQTTYTRDDAGNITRKLSARSISTDYFYDKFNRLTQVVTGISSGDEGSSTLYSYDKAGNLIEILDPKNNSTTFAYNSVNQLEKKVTSLGQITLLSYDGNGNVTKEIDPNGNVKVFTYNDEDQLISKVLPDNSYSKDLSLLVVMRQMRNKDLASSSSLYRVTTVEV